MVHSAVPHPRVGVGVRISAWPLILLLALGLALPVAIRRKAPVRALAIVLACCAGRCWRLGRRSTAGPFLPLCLVLYVVATTCRRPVAVAGLAGALALLVVQGIIAHFAGIGPGDSVGGALFLVIVWIVGYAVQQRRTYLAHLRDRAASDAVTRERLRIARELHDVVAHSMTVVTVQAGFGEYVFDSQPGEARAALGAIQAVSREALGEMQRLLCVLRQPEPDTASGTPAAVTGPGSAAAATAEAARGRRARPEAPLTPAPGLASLDRLVQRTAGAGVTVTVERTGTVRALPAGLDLSAFRIVQEALTNVVKHSGADRCQVRLGYGPGDLLIEVTDHGVAGPAGGCGGGARHPAERHRGQRHRGQRHCGQRHRGAGDPGRPGHDRQRAAGRARHHRHAGTGQPVRRRIQRGAASWWWFRGPGQAAATFSFMTLRVLVADDQALVRAGFRGIVAATPGFEVVGEAGTGAEAVEQARRHLPDVVLMDVRMPEMDGIEATRQITRSAATSGVRVLILTTFDLDEYVYSALRAGASGFLLKSISPAELLTAIQVIAAGDSLLAPSVTRRLVEEFARRPPAAPATPATAGVLDGITAREREVLALVASGLSNTEIARRLDITPATTKTHVGHLLTKLNARDRVHLVILAYQAGLAAPIP